MPFHKENERTAENIKNSKRIVDNGYTLTER
jgi:hypothetical protein